MSLQTKPDTGASLGGRVVIEAAARHPTGLAAIVSLSAETTIEDYPDFVPAAQQVTTPALYVGSSDDPLTQGDSPAEDPAPNHARLP